MVWRHRIAPQVPAILCTHLSGSNLDSHAFSTVRPNNLWLWFTTQTGAGRLTITANTSSLIHVPDDLLVAKVDFDADTVTMLDGENFEFSGISAGYRSGDFEVTPNQWDGRPNAGEFGLSGSKSCQIAVMIPTVILHQDSRRRNKSWNSC